MSVDPLFAYHKLNADGQRKAIGVAEAFSTLLASLTPLIDSTSDTPTAAVAASREIALVRTKLEEACFHAKKAMAVQPENQEPT